jgi:hypothetical protein
MESLCEGISRVIVDGLLEKDVLKRPEAPAAAGTPEPSEGTLAETGLIQPIGDMLTKKAVSTVEGLLNSEQISDKLLRVVEEKVRQVLADDLARSRRGGTGIIAEHVHLECARLFACESFRRELAELLRGDVERMVAPAVTSDVNRRRAGAGTEAGPARGPRSGSPSRIEAIRERLYAEGLL